MYKKLAWSSIQLNNRFICFGQVYDESIEYRVSNQIQVSINIVGIRYRTSTTVSQPALEHFDLDKLTVQGGDC